MKARTLKFLNWFFLIWGALSFVATIAFTVYGLYWIRIVTQTHDKIDSASPQDVRYVLDGCHFSDKQIEQVLHSHVGARGFLNGGYIDAFAIKISRVDDADFTPKPNSPNEHWFRGNQLPAVLDAAVRLVAGWHNKFPWFPTGTELRSPDVYMYPMDFYCCCGSVDPTMATLVFVRKTDNMMFYFNYRP